MPSISLLGAAGPLSGDTDLEDNEASGALKDALGQASELERKVGSGPEGRGHLRRPLRGRDS